MTCIAYRFPFIVADQRITYGNTNSGLITKVEKVSADGKTLYMAFSGDVGPQEEIGTYIVNDLITKQKNELFDRIRERYQGDKAYEMQFLCVLHDHETKTTQVLTYDEKLYKIVFKSEFYADGSGYTLALGAMAYGASAWDAVRIACEHDVSCGFPIEGYNVVTGEHYQFRDAYELKMAFQGSTKATSANGMVYDNTLARKAVDLLHEPLMPKQGRDTYTIEPWPKYYGGK